MNKSIFSSDQIADDVNELTRELEVLELLLIGGGEIVGNTH
jgi:hypothetical protein